MDRTHVVAALAGAALVLVSARGPELPRAFGQQAGGPSMFAVVAPSNVPGTNVLFVIDPASGRLLVYEHRAGARLELVTARDMRWDVQLVQFPGTGPNTPIPTIPAVRAAVQQQQPPQAQPGG